MLNREEEHKILIILSDGRPYDVILNRPNARNPQPYQGKYAISDTAFEVRKLRSKGVCVLGVFAGEEKDLPAVIKKTLEMPDADHNPYVVTEEMLVDAFDKLSNYNKTKTLLEG